ncbi:MAG TPA: sodium:solute symporter family protein, partial [Candidatus Baltobacteraceae bacterium]|nr:sodium:solute symporter family protein [Candidatus Baltobacteraceae bacterium]
EFFLAGRSLPVWITALAFISANLGAQEVIGMGASGAKYGIATAHFYWIGAIPAMVFIGVFMMPFYYGSRARSVPEYLKMRFDEKTRTFNACAFAIMTIFSSGISMYAMAQLLQTLHVFDDLFGALHVPVHFTFDFSVVISAVIVLLYILAGGLRSAVYNEVLQFCLIVAGFFPLVFLGLKNLGGWNGLMRALPHAYTHAWAGMGNPRANLLGVDAFSLVMGLGFVLSFGYWCTDYLVVQRAMAADSMRDARLTPVLAAVPKMLFPFLVILPGIIAVALTPGAFGDPSSVHGLIPVQIGANGQPVLNNAGQPVYDYNLAVPMMLLHYFPSGILGLGITALLASFMSGMAGNVTAFNTVWTYDIYQSHINSNASDAHYLQVGRLATVFGIAASVLAAYMAAQFNNIMDVLQLVFAFVNAPLFATFLLGMFWKRTSGHGAFTGLIAGTVAAAIHQGLTLPAGAGVGIKGGWIAVLHTYPSEMAQNFYTAIFAWCTCFAVTVIVSLLTKPREQRDLVGLVFSLTQRQSEEGVRWYARPAIIGAAVLACCIVLNVVFR